MHWQKNLTFRRISQTEHLDTLKYTKTFPNGIGAARGIPRLEKSKP